MKTGRYRYAVALLLFVAGAINYMDRAALGGVAPIISKELSLSPLELGIVFSSFFFDYSIFAFVGGHQLVSASRNPDDDRLRVLRSNRWERAIAGPIVGLIAVAYGWRTSFVIIAELRLVAWRLLATDRPAENRCVRAMEREMIEASRSAIHPAEAGNDRMPLRRYLMRPSRRWLK
jgi:ACS family hexuronate transporter-like MFS transporter